MPWDGGAPWTAGVTRGGGGGGGAAGFAGNGLDGDAGANLLGGDGGAGAGDGGAGGDGGDTAAAADLATAPGGGGGGGGSGASTVTSIGARGEVRVSYETIEDPNVFLRWSNDGGRTWSAERWSSAGLQGDYKKRVIWNRLGRARNRVFEIAMTTDNPWRLQNAYLDLRGGTR